MQGRNTQGTWGRYALFVLLSFAILLLNVYVQAVLRPQEQPAGDRQAAVAPDAGADAPPPVDPDQPPAEEPPDPVPGPQPEEQEPPPAGVDQPGQPEPEPVVEAREVVEAPDVPSQWVTLGSLDGADAHKMLITLTNRGAAIVRIELNEPNFHNLEDRSGYLGQVVMNEAVHGEGCPLDVVGPGTPAALAGLEAGDLITRVDGEQIAGFESLRTALLTTKPKQTVELTLSRGGEELIRQVKLRHRPLEIMRPEAGVPVDTGDGRLFGLRGVRPDEDDPLSFLMTLSQIDDLTVADVVKQYKKEHPAPESFAKGAIRPADESIEKEIEGVRLRSANWEILPGYNRTTVTFRRVLPQWGIEVVKTFRLLDGYDLTVDVKVLNTGTSVRRVAYQLDGPTGLPTEGYWYANKIGREWFAGVGLRDVAVFFEGGDPQLIGAPKIAADPDDAPWPWRGEDGSLTFLGVDAQYFAAVMIPQKESPEDIWLDQSQPLRVGPVDPKWVKCTNTSLRLTSIEKELGPGEPLAHEYLVFAGPKKQALLDKYGLGELLYYGWFSVVARAMLWLLHIFYAVVRNYGLAILMLTVLVRLCMFPLSKKQALGAQKMAELQPEIKKIQEKYKKDVEGRTKAQQDLFKKHNYNPLSGCLVLFFQLPIFIGLYRGLMVDVGLRQAPLISEGFRWCSNLAAPDMLYDWTGFMPAFVAGAEGFLGLGPYFNLLPMITIALFLWQQKMFMPPPADDQAAMQQKMMKFMMLFMGIIFFKVASGLCIYFIASSLWGVAERKFLPKRAAAAADDKPSKAPDPKPPRRPPPGSDPAARNKRDNGDGAASRKKKKKNRGRR